MGAEVEGDTLGDEVNSTEHSYRYVHVISLKKSKFSCTHAGGQCCGSGMFIPDPKTAMKDKVKKNLLSYLCFGAINFTIWSLSSQKYGFGIRIKPILDPGVKRAPDPDPQHCCWAD
jgi:hypothetical protein